jgi:hypothetical protein
LGARPVSSSSNTCAVVNLAEIRGLARCWVGAPVSFFRVARKLLSRARSLLPGKCFRGSRSALSAGQDRVRLGWRLDDGPRAERGTSISCAPGVADRTRRASPAPCPLFDLTRSTGAAGTLSSTVSFRRTIWRRLFSSSPARREAVRISEPTSQGLRIGSTIWYAPRRCCSIASVVRAGEGRLSRRRNRYLERQLRLGI